jgi:hypothetical protein
VLDVLREGDLVEQPTPDFLIRHGCAISLASPFRNPQSAIRITYFVVRRSQRKHKPPKASKAETPGSGTGVAFMKLRMNA